MPVLRQKLTIEAEPAVWLAVLGQIDLALRHPKNDGAAARVAERFGDALRDKLLVENVISKEVYAMSLREQVKYRKNRDLGLPR
jgi:hypothetical protein